MPSDTSQTSSNAAEQATLELLKLITGHLKTARRVIALYKAPISPRSMAEAGEIAEAAGDLYDAVREIYAGEAPDEPLTPPNYRFAAGR